MLAVKSASVRLSFPPRSSSHRESRSARFDPGQCSVPWTSHLPRGTDRSCLRRVLCWRGRGVWWTRGRRQVCFQSDDLWVKMPQTISQPPQNGLLLCLCFTGVLKETSVVLGRRAVGVFNLPEYFSTWNVHSKFRDTRITFIGMSGTFDLFHILAFLLPQVSAQGFFPNASRFTVRR